MVKDNLNAFLESVKKEHDGDYPPTKDILIEYVAFMGTKSQKFANVDPRSLSTRHPGVYNIYDAIRKKTKLLDEKAVTPVKSPPKLPTPKDVKATKAEDQN